MRLMEHWDWPDIKRIFLDFLSTAVFFSGAGGDYNLSGREGGADEIIIFFIEMQIALESANVSLKTSRLSRIWERKSHAFVSTEKASNFRY